MIPVLLTAVLVTFALMHAAPGNPWSRANPLGLGGHGSISSAGRRALDERYGLDRSWWEQLGRYLWGVLHLDFGPSYQYPRLSATTLLFDGATATAILGSVAFAVSVAGGVGLGALAALRRRSPIDRLVTVLATFGAAVPNFVVGVFGIVLLSVWLRQATGGAVSLPDGGFGLDQHLVLPVVTLSLFPAAYLARLTRASILDVLGDDHIRSARGRGLRERVVIVGHVLPNALVPILTTLGPLFGYLITGGIVVEDLFQIHGLGGTYVTAIAARDYPVILAGTIVYALVFSAVNLVADVLYVVVDPRVSLA